jgi:hypothetical protein
VRCYSERSPLYGPTSVCSEMWTNYNGTAPNFVSPPWGHDSTRRSPEPGNTRPVGPQLAPILDRSVSLATRDAGWGGADLVVKLASPVSTKSSHPGESFSAQVIWPEDYAKMTATVEGRIKDVKPAAAKRQASISFQFDTLVLKGVPHPIHATVIGVSNSKGTKGVTENGEILGITSHKKRIGIVAGGGILGALAGAVAGGPRGAAIGAASSSMAGALVAIMLTAKASDVEFFPGSQFSLQVLDARRTAASGKSPEGTCDASN